MCTALIHEPVIILGLLLPSEAHAFVTRPQTLCPPPKALLWGLEELPTIIHYYKAI